MTDSQVIIGSRYRLLEQIGRGGMGTVWRARDEVLGRDVAVKEVIPSPDLSSLEREIFTLRTLREARAAGRIGHPGVATVYDVIEESDRPWIVMQLVDSRTLGAVVREDGPLPPRRVAEIALDVLGALVAAHRVGVLHRDVKPDNVLIARNGRAVLTDFGIAMLEGDSSVTRTGALIGTPAFIAPERAGGGPAEFASDLWSLGVTMYMAVEGRSPFERAHPLATLSAVMHQDPPPLRSAGPLAPAIFGLLGKDPARRMTAEELQIHLQAIVSGAEPQPTAPVALPSGAVPRPRAASGTLPGAVAAAAARAEATPPESPGEPPGYTPGRPQRRRLPGGALVAAALAATLASGAFAWVNVTDPGSATIRQTVPASVPVKKKAPEKAKPSEAPATKEPTGTRDGGGTGRSTTSPPTGPRQSGDARRDGAGGAEDAPAPKPDDRPSKDPGKGAEKEAGEKPEKNSGEKPEKDSGEKPEKPKDQGKAPEDSGEGNSRESDREPTEEGTRNQGENQGGDSVDPYSGPNATGGKAPEAGTEKVTVLAGGREAG
ncbi:protein kinase domain-containing protein [Streptosporangium sandarakinum]